MGNERALVLIVVLLERTSCKKEIKLACKSPDDSDDRFSDKSSDKRQLSFVLSKLSMVNGYALGNIVGLFCKYREFGEVRE